jgi:hypothetical protein
VRFIIIKPGHHLLFLLATMLFRRMILLSFMYKTGAVIAGECRKESKIPSNTYIIQKVKTMNKSTISLFAMTAGVLAIASAFTTKPGKAAITFRHYGVAPNTFCPGTSVALAEAGTLIYDAGTSDISITQALLNSPADDGCSTDATCLCAAEIKNNNGTKTVNETKLGDFFVNPL